MRRRNLWLGTGAAVAVFAVFLQVGISQALWSGDATVTGTISVQSGTATLQATGMQSLVFTGGSSYLDTLTLTSTGTESLSDFTATVAAGPTDITSYDPNLAAHIAVTVWPLPSSASCGTPPAGSPTGTWAAWPANPFPGLTLTLAGQSGTSAQYCVLSTWDGSTTTPGQTQPTVTISAASDVGAATGSQAPAMQATAPITVTPSQVGVTSTDSISTSVSGAGIVQTNYGSTGDNDIATPGTIVNTSNFCTMLTINGSGATHDWSVKIDATQPPYYGANLTAPKVINFDTGPSGTIVGYVSHAAGDPAGTYTITGAGPVSASHPFGSYSNSTGLFYDTPIADGQSTTVRFCMDSQSGNPAPVLAAAPTTYAITIAPHIVDCGASNSMSDAAPSNTLPQKGVWNVCWYLQLTGYYPHFYIGWSYSFNWADLVNATYGPGGAYGSGVPSWYSGTQSQLVTALLTCKPATSVNQQFQHTVPVTGENNQSGGYGTGGSNLSVTGSGASAAVTVTFDGIYDSTGGITNNMYINSFGRTSC